MLTLLGQTGSGKSLLRLLYSIGIASSDGEISWRRTVTHHDRELAVSAAWVWLAEARMLLNRLTYPV